MKIWIDSSELGWQADFNGNEVGFDDVDVVGFYMWRNLLFEINAETGEILYIGCYEDEDGEFK